MKRIFIALPLIMLIACNTPSDADKTEPASDTANSAQANLPYTIERPVDWERGAQSNVAVAMNTLKAFEKNDMNALKGYLADSVEFYHDQLIFKGPKDSLVQIFSQWRNSVDTIHIVMHDYETVKSKGRGEEWVALWYTESVTQNNKVDSAMVMDDIRLVNGKVTVIDSKSRKLKPQQ